MITIKFTFSCGEMRYLKLSEKDQQRMETGTNIFYLALIFNNIAFHLCCL